jgi:hypothetical protein
LWWERKDEIGAKVRKLEGRISNSGIEGAMCTGKISQREEKNGRLTVSMLSAVKLCWDFLQNRKKKRKKEKERARNH